MTRGFALPVTLVAMVVIGGLVAAVLFVAIVGRRSGGAALEVVRVQFAAEAAAHRVAGDLSPSGDLSPLTATSMPVSDAALTVGGGQLTRFGSSVWLVDAVESGERFGALRRAGLLLVSRPVNVLLRKGLVTTGPVSLSGVSGVDLFGAEAGEGCGVSVADSLPGVLDFGSVRRESLNQWLGLATKTFPGGALISPQPELRGGVCNKTVVSNWGDATDPMGVCRDFFPVVGVFGDVTVDGGQGQGVLVVTGNLTARAGFHFRGLVVVGRSLVLEGGARMLGAVQVDDSLDEGSTLVDSQIAYSGCVLRQALSDFGLVSPLEERGWFQPY